MYQKRGAADPIYNSKVVTKFINQLMLNGKKVLHKNSI